MHITAYKAVECDGESHLYYGVVRIIQEILSEDITFKLRL